MFLTVPAGGCPATRAIMGLRPHFTDVVIPEGRHAMIVVPAPYGQAGMHWAVLLDDRSIGRPWPAFANRDGAVLEPIVVSVLPQRGLRLLRYSEPAAGALKTVPLGNRAFVRRTNPSDAAGAEPWLVLADNIGYGRPESEFSTDGSVRIVRPVFPPYMYSATAHGARSQGPAVVLLQMILKLALHAIARDQGSIRVSTWTSQAPTGVYDTRTVTALKTVQRYHDLPAHGNLDPVTRQLLSRVYGVSFDLITEDQLAGQTNWVDIRGDVH